MATPAGKSILLVIFSLRDFSKLDAHLYNILNIYHSASKKIESLKTWEWGEKGTKKPVKNYTGPAF